MKNVLTITGDIGSGKSTVAGLLAERLDYKVVTTGAIQRELAARKRLTSLELNELSMKDRRVDDTIDSYLQQLSGGADRLILDSRLAWHFVQGAFNVFVRVDPRVGAERVLSHGRPQERHHGVEDAMRNNLRRRDLENRRFEQLYSIRCDDLDNYQLLVDSTWVSPESVAEVILDAFQQRGAGRLDAAQGGPIAARARLCPRSLYPTKDVRGLSPPRAAQPPPAVAAIEVFRLAHYFFILDGHARVSCALRQGIAHIPCRLEQSGVAADAQRLALREKIIASLAQPWVQEWEAAHQFNYPSYPDASGAPCPERK